MATATITFWISQNRYEVKAASFMLQYMESDYALCKCKTQLQLDFPTSVSCMH